MKLNTFALSIFGIGCYFIYHLINGQYGLIAWVHVHNDIQKNKQTLKELILKKNEVEMLVTHLSPGNIDPDLLDERARTILGYAHKDEHVIILNPTS